jgi:hypothetical protein
MEAQTLDQAPSYELQQPEQRTAQGVVDSVIGFGIEVEDRDRVCGALSEIIDDFGISEDAFSDKGNAIIMTAVATMSADLDEEYKGRESDNGYFYGKSYLSDLIMSVVGTSTEFAEIVEEEHSTSAVSDAQTRKVLDKYSHPELSEEVVQFIDGSEFDDVRDALGIDKESQEPFEVRVLTINTDADYGLIPRVDYNGVAFGSEEWNQLLQDQDTIQEYELTLKQRAEDMNAELGREGSFAPAWVNHMDDGSTILCISSGLAEKLLYPTEERANFYTPGDRVRDLAVLKHEFTHTQKPITKHVGVGIAMEELRAEYFSGMKQGYMDVKKFSAGVRMFLGKSIPDSFSPSTGYDRAEFIQSLTESVGLRNMLDIMSGVPANYASDEDCSIFTRDIVSHNGGLNGLLARIHNRAETTDGPEVVEDRVSNYIDNLRTVLNGATISVESSLVYGGISELARAGIDNFRRRYPEESDGYDYFN